MRWNPQVQVLMAFTIILIQLYKGWLRDGSVVLVNCVKIKQKGLPHSIMQQVEVLHNLRHRHMVSVLGHCVITEQEHPQTTSTVFIVFEYISNVSLRDQLSGKQSYKIKAIAKNTNAPQKCNMTLFFIQKMGERGKC